MITNIGGNKIVNMLDLRKAIYSYRVGDTVRIDVRRRGRSHTFYVILGTKPI